MDIVYRASELGGCSKFLIAKRMGYTEMAPPAKFQGYFQRGNDVETVMREELLNRGFNLTDDQTEVALHVTNTIRVVGHTDGLISDGVATDSFRPMLDQTRVWECKRVSPAIYKQFVEHGWDAKYDLLDKYKWQVSCYMVATGKELRFDVVDGSSVTEDELELRYHTLYLEVPFYSELQIKTRVLSLEAAALNDGLPDTCDKPSYPCPFYYLPGHDNEDEDETNDQINALALACVESKREADSAKQRNDDLRAQLLSAMGDRTRVRADSATISVAKSTRTVTDWEALGKVVNLSEYQKKEEGVTYVRITPRTAKETAEVRSERE